VTVSRRLERLIPPTVVLLALVACLPGLTLPFLSDDWAQIEAAGDARLSRTPFGDFRPLFMASLWLDLRLWGPSPGPFHVTNAILIVACVLLVFLVARRYTRDNRLAGAAAALFALHPYHVENAAWVAARSDPLFVVPYLLGLLAYDRWRTGEKGIPLLALAAFETALLAKETAVTLPVLLILVGLLDRSRRPSRLEWTRGLLPMLVLAVVHFAILRTWVLEGTGRTLASGIGLRWVKNLAGLGTGAILPLDVEFLAFRPMLWGSVAALLLAAVVVFARRRSGRIPPVALASAAGFTVLVAPYVVAFEERYVFLPAAAAALGIASLAAGLGRRVGPVLIVVVGIAWAVLGIQQWGHWNAAATASERLVSSLALESADPAIDEIVLTNVPYRVAGGSVAGDFRAALQVRGSRPIPVRAATWVSYASPRSRGLAVPPLVGTRSAEVALEVPEGPFSRFVGPSPPAGEDELETSVARVVRERSGSVRVAVEFAPERGRAVYAWDEGELVRLRTGSGSPSRPPR
jgi:hypothetical protein